ncbi:Unknown protein [Striga hermonthica]|uniref:XS domain-containing protein n=1 Tax=Striga hermonthica TaxID=68872 RepID=A0A9N7N2T1_STRHE|nr:Unknown protein [Striga hermonthica]
MSERRYRVRSRGRSPSPRRPPARPRDLSPSRPRNYPSDGRYGKEEYFGGPRTSRRIEKRDDFNRDFRSYSPRSPEYVHRDRDKYAAGDRWLRRSPLRIRSPREFEKRDEFKRDNDTSRNMRLPDYDAAAAAAAGKTFKDGAHIGHSMRSYHEGSYPWDHILDGPRKPVYLSVNDYGGTPDYIRVRERDYYPQYTDNTKTSLALGHGGVDDVVHASNLGSADVSGHRPPVSSSYLNTCTSKLGCAHLEDKRQLEKRNGSLRNEEDHLSEMKRAFFLYQDGSLGVDERERDESYGFKKGNSLLSSQGHLKGDYIHSREYISVPRGTMEGFLGCSPSRDRDMPSKLSQKGSGLTSQPIGFDGYTGSQFDDTRSTSRLYRPPQEKQDNDLFSEFGRSKIGSTSTRHNDVEEDYRDHHMSRNVVFNPAVDECPHMKPPMRDDGQWGPYSSQVRSMPDDRLDASRSVHARKQECDMLGAGNSRLDYDIVGYREYVSVEKDDHCHHHSRMDVCEWSRDERLDSLLSSGYESHDPSFGRFYDSPSKNLGLEDVDLDETFGRRLRNKHGRDEMYEQDVGIRISADGNGARKIYNREKLGDEIGFADYSKKPRSSRANFEESRMGFSNITNSRPTSSRSHPRKPGSGDIKKRLGPVPHKLHVSQRLFKKHKPSVMKRLAPAPTKKHGPTAIVKNRSSQFPKSIQDSDGNPRTLEDHLGDHIINPKPEPPEESEDFKQLVQNAFFKYLKQINEMPGKRKKYLEHGKAGSLKCIVCGSNSDEFAETESLARHAVSSKKVGLRSQHLGLHRALCALMGWKISEQPSSPWVCEVMSSAESSALKEDLIIWPPVVIVYNSAIDNKNPDERIIVSPEKLDLQLRDMGFVSIVKVCNGKPANQSVMLVKFNGTLSGLQEAVKYHKRYLESKHGRDELNQLKSDNQMSAHVTSTNKEEDFLYGYLGIVEDLDKLDFDTKKRCVLRSKNEIMNIVNIPLATGEEN